MEQKVFAYGAGRRKVPRRVFVHKVGLLSQGVYVVGQSHEIGEGGIKISTNLPLILYGRVVITLSIPNYRFISVQAETRYREKEGQQGYFAFGFEFKTIDFHDRRKIRNFVAAKTEQDIQV